MLRLSVFILIFNFCFGLNAFENKTLSFADPSGWVTQKTEVPGINALYFSVPANRKSPSVLISTTSVRPNKMNPNDFVRQSLASEAKKYKDFVLFGLKELPEIKSPHALKQFTYTKNNIRYKGMVLLAQSEKENYLFHFTADESVYPTYESEVLAVFKSIKLKK